MKQLTLKISVILSIIFSLKAVYSVVTITSLKWFIYPMIPFIRLFTDISFAWLPEIGFVSESGIIIEKSCAGGNFFIICLAFLCFKLCVFQSLRRTILQLVFFSICSYFIMLIANTIRIISAIKLTSFSWTHAFIDPKNAHLALGSILYIFILLSINHYISKKHVTIQTT